MYVFLNTRQPPFTSLKARQAINYAIDRGQIIQLLHSGFPAQATCQILPAGFPSYEQYCPYTTGVKDGGWHGPDLAKAVRLAHESGTTQVPVTVWSDKDFGGEAVGSYLVGILKDLGYRANLRIVSDSRFYAAATNSRDKVQLGLTGWATDVPLSSGFFSQALTCRSFYQDPARTNNLAEFCDPHADQLVSKAQAAQQTDPAAARALWAQADRVVTDQSPWVPISNVVRRLVRLCQGPELPGIPVLRRPAPRPDVGPIGRATSPPGPVTVLSSWRTRTGAGDPLDRGGHC